MKSVPLFPPEVSRVFQVRSSAIHGTGLCAAVPLTAGTHIMEYIGERISKEESLRRRQKDNFFVFSVTDSMDIDGAVDWNPERFINHSCGPNCEAVHQNERIWIVA